MKEPMTMMIFDRSLNEIKRKKQEGHLSQSYVNHVSILMSILAILFLFSGIAFSYAVTQTASVSTDSEELNNSNNVAYQNLDVIGTIPQFVIERLFADSIISDLSPGDNANSSGLLFNSSSILAGSYPGIMITFTGEAPETTLLSAPASPTSSTSAMFIFNSSLPARFECSLDGAAFAACVSPKTYSGLAEGTHTFSVRAIDALGNADSTPFSYSWTINFGAPGGGSYTPSGCAYSNPSCGVGYSCVNNACIQLTGCAYSNPACPSGLTCVNNACVCPSGQSLCGSTCINTNTDPLNCGSCGNVCSSGKNCVLGQCLESCSSTQVRCGSSCVNINSDFSNCGSCGNVCGPGLSCRTGQCTSAFLSIKRILDCGNGPCRITFDINSSRTSNFDIDLGSYLPSNFISLASISVLNQANIPYPLYQVSGTVLKIGATAITEMFKALVILPVTQRSSMDLQTLKLNVTLSNPSANPITAERFVISIPSEMQNRSIKDITFFDSNGIRRTITNYTVIAENGVKKIIIDETIEVK